jgi:hypothetical protein
MKQLVRLATTGVAAVMLVAAGMVWAPPKWASAGVACPTDIIGGLTPDDDNYNDSGSVNIGTYFKANGAPYVRGVTFYKGTGNTGTHVAHLRKVGSSTDLASATFSGETASGWQTVNFSSDVELPDSGFSATYVVWVSMPNGHYAFTNYGLQNGIGSSTNDVAYIPAGQSSVYAYTSDDTVVPTNTTYHNYFVAPIVGDDTDPDANTDVTATNASGGPTVDWTTGNDTNGSITGSWSRYTELLRSDGTNNVVIGSMHGSAQYWGGIDTYEQSDVTAVPGTTYSYSMRNTDYCGNTSTSSSATPITTPSQSLSRLFSTDPTTLDSGQTTPVTVGMHWQTDTDGKVWGARIYRAANTAPTQANSNGFTPALRAALWDGSGNELAHAYLPIGNQQSGWIDVQFPTPVDVDANTDYVIGYYSPNGREVYTNNVFDSIVSNGNLSAREDTSTEYNGVYYNGNGFPNSRPDSDNSSWYGVDVDFYIP